jgi:hypothetical protein
VIQLLNQLFCLTIIYYELVTIILYYSSNRARAPSWNTPLLDYIPPVG